ncbi:MAG: hypothetical protein GTO60_00110, partial [Gammaproteobacteria bacterium]|nr:hypothetical protein [Gammaproteobacteria bacterium]
MINLKIPIYGVATIFLIMNGPVSAQGNSDELITDEMLQDPDPADWLMHSRTYD